MNIFTARIEEKDYGFLFNLEGFICANYDPDSNRTTVHLDSASDPIVLTMPGNHIAFLETAINL